MYAHVPKRTTHFFGGALMDSDTFAFTCGACGAGYSSLNPTTTLSQCEHGKPHKGKTGRGISTKLGRAHSKSSRAASSSASTSSSMSISSPRDRFLEDHMSLKKWSLELPRKAFFISALAKP